MSDGSDIDGLHATALSVLSKIFLRLGNPKRSTAVLKATIPSLIRQGHIWFQAEAFLTLAKCRLQLANCRDKNANKRLSAACKELRKSKELFSRCHDLVRLKEVLYLEARVSSALGDITRRDAASHDFIKVAKYLQQRTSKLNLVDSIGEPHLQDQLIARSIPVWS